MLLRRDFTKLALAATAAAVPASAKINSVFGGVPLGAQSYSFRDRDVDGAVAAMKEIGIGYTELFSGHVEPKVERGPAGQAALKKWRLEVKKEEIAAIKAKFDAAGINIYAFNYSFRDSFSDEEIDKGFVIAKWLGAKYITASSNVATAKRVAPAAAKHKMIVGMHNHSRIVPNEFATAENFATAMKEGPFIGINLDIGHFWAANFDAVPFMKEHHQHIVTIHVKDRKKNQGDNMPFGQGDTPIKEVLLQMKANKWKIPAMIEYEYKGADTVAEVKKCFEYCKAILTA
ncbi:MAG: sugar phosphate isomerase/epimerase [Bryobacteraceae bacterium]|nr:sugar phosphate isomerase/epimerase [Bryobacteraceae bacterium]